MNVQLRKSLLPLAWKYLALLVFLFGIVELSCYTIYVINPMAVFGWQFYDSAFDKTKISKLSYGWTSPEGLPRPGDAPQKNICAAAFGDSFTFADEVETDEAWPNVASKILNCKIENYGVGGFGLDQTYLLYREINPDVSIVIIGIYPEMIRRNLAASWIFYGAEKEKTLKPRFEIKDSQLKQTIIPERNNIFNIKKYHAEDRFFQPYNLHFPYSYTLARFIFTKLYLERQTRDYGVMNDAHAMQLHSALIEALRSAIKKNGSKIVFVFYPTVSAVQTGDFSYQQYLSRFEETHPEDCMIDTGPSLNSAVKKDKININAGSGHYSKQGNLIVAKVVAERLKACGLM